MSWISTLDRWQWALFAAVPIGIILLYFLKLRREPVEIPSTYLWSRTVEDLHVNSLFQRIRRNLLLFLQLLAVALAAFALLRPGIRGQTSAQPRSIFLLDASASMMARDTEGRQNRFETARKMIRDRIDAMDDRETAMLITFSDRAEVLQSFTSDRNRLRAALDQAQVTNRPTDIIGALEAADGLANPRRSSTTGDENDVQVADPQPADLLVYSDGGFRDVEGFDVGNLKPVYRKIGSDQARNLAITAFNADRNVEQAGAAKAFGTINNFGASEETCNVSLYVNGQWRDSASVTLGSGEETGLSFSLADQEDAATLEVRLESSTGGSDQPFEDDLLIDNYAYAGLRPLRTVSVLVITTGNKPLRLGLSTDNAAKICVPTFKSPDYLQTPEYAGRAEAGLDDLIIYDRCRPEALPNTNTFFIGALPSDQWSWASEPGQTILVDVDRTHPMMQYLELFSLLIFQGRAVEGPPGTRELVGGDAGTVLALAPRDGYQDLVLGFELITTGEDGSPQTNTNWYAERSWPVFLLNVLRYLAGAADATSAPSFLPGDTIRLRVESQLESVDIARGNGTPETVPTGASGSVEYVDSDVPGAYKVIANGKLVDLFCINLFGGRESDILPRESFDLGYETVETAGTVETRKEYWRWLLLGMLALIAVEWWLYNRRIA
ncbi:VWA domain-containing protein [Roseiconus nitratireducens]|uniref:VWA domain-containing protein n=1 Tax=Roseiconus nitratireducens TaxID=2605748 RepID=A0A5M6CV42_9BACT|nr:VWA domain-containing protein [Roseiconus nitratireducens]KAA5538816.1 VWA domain-containing protein [Roseiconus nitratireducens]